ncbi:MAG: TolC family protein [Verrucomicrobia bacterium]|nr:TolC family protein [Verrucomicrobiota bacterium]
MNDPFALAPSDPYASWTPMRGNALVSSRFCKTLLPPSFDSKSEMSLAELLDIALQNNPVTKQTWAQARSAAAAYGQSLSPFYPNVAFDGSFTRQRGTFVDEGPPTLFFQTTAGPDATLSYTLFDFGQRTAAAMAAREALYYADLTHNQQIQAVIQIVMDDYYNYLYQIQVLRASEMDIKNAEAALDAANQKFALGLAALGDVAQARTQYLQSKINLTNQKQYVENSFAQLATDIGLPANLSFKVQQIPDQISMQPLLESVDTLIAKAQTQRQDFLASQSQVRSKEASLLQAKRAMLPVLGTNLDFGKYYFQGGASEDYHWTAVISLDFPIFRGFYYKNGVRQAEANLELARAQMMQTELSIIQDVTTSHMNVKTAALNLTDTAEYVKAAELEFNIALGNYKAGTNTILNVMSAQSSLADARAKRAAAQKEWFTALASIAYATGSLCATPNEAPCVD